MAAMKRFNPLCCNSKEMPENFVLMAKLLVLSLLLGGQFSVIPAVDIPLFSFLDPMQGLPFYREVLQALFVLGCVLVLFNVNVRKGCLIISLVVFFSILASRGYFRNHRLAYGCFLFLLGLQDERASLRNFIWMQISFIYLGAGLTKLFSPDWRSGDAMVFFYKVFLPESVSEMSIFLGKKMAVVSSYATIILQYLLALGFLIRRFHKHSVIAGVAFHALLLVVSRSCFGVFFHVMLISYLSTARWDEAAVSSKIPLARLIDSGASIKSMDWRSLGGALARVPAVYFFALITFQYIFVRWIDQTYLWH